MARPNVSCRRPETSGSSRSVAKRAAARSLDAAAPLRRADSAVCDLQREFAQVMLIERPMGGAGLVQRVSRGDLHGEGACLDQPIQPFVEPGRHAAVVRTDLYIVSSFGLRLD